MSEVKEEGGRGEERKESVKEYKQVSEETKRQILNSEELHNFLTRNYKYIERVRSN